MQALKDAGDDTDVQCTENEQGHVHQDFQVMLQKMERSVFCLVVPGDAQSTRRLSEIFMAGCIPVFVGPPYNTMPLPDDVHYKSIGVFFNITTYHSWLPTVSLTSLLINSPKLVPPSILASAHSQSLLIKLMRR